MLISILGLLLLLFAVGLSVIIIGPLRRAFITTQLFAWFKSVLPPMSETEQQAIAAGDTWQDANLFRGQPDWKNFLAEPKPSLSQAELLFLNHEVETLCAMLNEWQITHYDLDFPLTVWNYIKTAGFFGLHIPKEYGGLEFSALASSTIVQKIATKSLSVAVTVMVPNSLGPAELILHYGTAEQKKKYLHHLARGTEMPCFALTAPDAGSDATAITDEGVVCTEGGVLGIRLNWNKRYITLAPVATLIGLAIKLKDPDQLLGTKPELGITVVLVPSNLPGIDIGKRHFPLNQAFMNGPIRGRDVFLPIENIIGGQAMIGQGWKMLVECLAAGRGVSLPALSTAMGKHSFRVTGAYAKIRKQFNLSIGNFEGVATPLARIGGLTYMLEATRLLTLGAIDRGKKPSVITAISKYHMTEFARSIINDAMDIHGGRGIMLGPRNYLARLYEGVPISITVEGANILTRCLMIFGQGAIRCHPYVLQEMLAVNNPDQKQGLLDFDRALCAHVWYSVCNYTRLKLHTITGARFSSVPANSQWDKYYRQLNLMSMALASTSDIAMLVLGGRLKRKENLSARLGDVLSYLYIASAVLKYNSDAGQPAGDQAFVQWSLDYCLHMIQKSFAEFFDNFPNRYIAQPLSWLVLPFWRNYKAPCDDLALTISANMMLDTELRQRLIAQCYSTSSDQDSVGRVEQTWLKMLAVEPILSKLEVAVKLGKIAKNLRMFSRIKAAQDIQVISEHEAQLLNEFETMRLDAIQVDEFTEAELLGSKNHE